MKKSGFTLAEILISLMILGVIAALTIPVLIRNNMRLSIETALKKNVSVWDNAFKMAVVKSGESVSEWNLNGVSDTSDESVAYIKKYLAPNLNIVEYVKGEGGTGNKCIANNARGEQVHDDYCQIILADGSSASIENYGIGTNGHNTFGYAVLNVDLNGRKGPNKYGYDSFLLVVVPDDTNGNGVHVTANPIGNPFMANTPWTEYKDVCYNDPNPSMLGRWCAGVIIGNGYKIPDDYPWVR